MAVKIVQFDDILCFCCPVWTIKCPLSTCEVHFAKDILNPINADTNEESDMSAQPLYDIDLQDIKSFLMGQHPHDPILSKIFRIMN